MRPMRGRKVRPDYAVARSVRPSPAARDRWPLPKSLAFIAAVSAALWAAVAAVVLWVV